MNDIIQRLKHKRFHAVAAVGYNNEIGLNGKMPWETTGMRLKRDLKRFKALTMGRVVIVGRKTWESLPGPLPGRDFIVLTNELAHETDEIVFVPHKDGKHCMVDLDQLEYLIETEYGDRDGFMVAGGSEIYALFEPVINRCYITVVKETFNADTYFPIDILDVSKWRENYREYVDEEQESGEVIKTAHITINRR